MLRDNTTFEVYRIRSNLRVYSNDLLSLVNKDKYDIEK
jgi:hypothetical protein